MKKYLFAVISGIITIFTFPTVLFGFEFPNLGFLAWLSLVPLFIALHNTKARQAFVLTFITAAIYYFGSLYWLYNAMHSFGRLSPVASTLVLVLLIVIISTYISLAPMLAKLLSTKNHIPMLVAMPVLWTVCEIARNYMPCNGFPWSNLAMSQYKYLPVIQIVDIVGVYGLTFMIVWTNQFLADCILQWHGNRKELLPKTIVTGLIFVIIFSYGFWRIADVKQKSGYLNPVKIALLQGNIKQEDKESRTQSENIFNVYKDLLKKADIANVDLAIWPETAYPWAIKDDPQTFSSKTFGLVNRNSVYPFSLIGAVVYDEANKDGQRKIYNRAILATRQGTTVGHYDKSHLVPYGEYVPFKKYLFFVEKLVSTIGEFEVGKSFIPLSFGNFSFGNLICYEDIFPELSRKATNLGADFLVNITNDAWYGVSSAPYQHLALSVFRSVENRKYMARSTNTGVSAVIAPTGNIEMQSKIFTKAIMVTNIGAGNIDSIYSNIGDWFAYACCLYVLILICINILKKKRDKHR